MQQSEALKPAFGRLGVVLRPTALLNEQLGVLNPACARLRDGSLQIYPRMVAPGNVSRIGSFRAQERSDGTVSLEQMGTALAPEAPYERSRTGSNYGCEDPRVTFVPALDLYLMAYVALCDRGPEIAVAISDDGLAWRRLGLVRFADDASIADKDAAFFPEPVRSPSGEECLALYHRPTLSHRSNVRGEGGIDFLRLLPPEEREGIAIGYISLAAVRRDLRKLCTVVETHRLSIPPAAWGTIKVGGGTPPVRIREGWLAVIHGVDEIRRSDGSPALRYCAGVIVHDAERIDTVVYRSPQPLFVPERPGELEGTVGNVVFPTAIDQRSERAFDVYYGMADDAIGRGRLTID